MYCWLFYIIYHAESTKWLSSLYSIHSLSPATLSPLWKGLYGVVSAPAYLLFFSFHKVVTSWQKFWFSKSTQLLLHLSVMSFWGMRCNLPYLWGQNSTCDAPNYHVWWEQKSGIRRRFRKPLHEPQFHPLPSVNKMPPLSVVVAVICISFDSGLKLNGTHSFWFMLTMLTYWVEAYIL
jgi:hypothetical protein